MEQLLKPVNQAFFNPLRCWTKTQGKQTLWNKPVFLLCLHTQCIDVVSMSSEDSDFIFDTIFKEVLLSDTQLRALELDSLSFSSLHSFKLLPLLAPPFIEKKFSFDVVSR
mmetsp:Transcript_1502/g.1703  ORF Transcript_1502/g.1703 Transcript_1502/m.1703 type:complete len:110 (+) Transcript_1502:655-984(+)